MEVVKQKKAETETLEITCHLCKKICLMKPIEKIPDRNPDTAPIIKTPEPESLINNENHGQRKKKRKKDVNAGLTIPAPAQKTFCEFSKSPSMTNTTFSKTNSASKAKLKMLMSKSDSLQRGGLQDFLKKL